MCDNVPSHARGKRTLHFKTAADKRPANKYSIIMVGKQKTPPSTTDKHWQNRNHCVQLTWNGIDGERKNYNQMICTVGTHPNAERCSQKPWTSVQVYKSDSVNSAVVQRFSPLKVGFSNQPQKSDFLCLTGFVPILLTYSNFIKPNPDSAGSSRA